jgi:nitroreductase
VLNGADRAGRLLAAICHGPLALSASLAVKGKRVTVQGQSGREALRQAGALLVDEIAVVDGRLITGQWPHLETFAVTVAERLQYPRGGGPYQQWLDARPAIGRAIDDQRAAHRFEAREVGPGALEQIIRAALKTVAAPSIRGPRAVRVVAVRDKAAKAALALRIFESSKSSFAARGTPENTLRQQVAVLFEQAPALCFVFVDRAAGNGGAAEEAMRAEVAYAGAMGANLLLAARSIGLGVAPLGLPAFLVAEPELKRVLAAPDSALLVNIFAIGYPEVSTTPAVSRPASDILVFERWR